MIVSKEINGTRMYRQECRCGKRGMWHRAIATARRFDRKHKAMCATRTNA